MTSSEFFGAIENNLRQLAEVKIDLPQCNLPALISKDGKLSMLGGMIRLNRLEILTHRDRLAPPDVRVYDLVSMKLPMLGALRFRIFAAFAGEATPESYRNAKYRIRKWYQESGWAESRSKAAFAGAIVVGADSSWPADMRPNADDIPFAHVAFQMLTAPHERSEIGVTASRLGDGEVGETIFRALIPETFEAREQRVASHVERLFRQQCGTVTVERVAADTGMPAGDVFNIFHGLQAKGVGRIGKKRGNRRLEGLSPEEQVYIEPGSAAFWRRILSRRMGAWYRHKGVCTVVSLGALGCLMSLCGDFLKDFVIDLLCNNQLLLIGAASAVGAAGIGCAVFFILKRK